MINIKHHTTPERLEKYSFLWSELRLVIAAVALLIGGIPPVFLVVPFSFLLGLTGFLLQLCWIISGIASGYLLYMWNKGGQKVFGGKHNHDVWAFFVMIVSGFNLGITGVFGTNIGMSISHNRFIFTIVAVIYLVSALHLYNRFKKHGEKVF